MHLEANHRPNHRTRGPVVLRRRLALKQAHTHPNRSRFGRDIAQVNLHQLSSSFSNFSISSTSQGLWEQKGPKTRVRPYGPLVAVA